MPEHGNDTTTPSGGVDVLEREDVGIDTGWNTILWNDPVNLFDYVVATLMSKLELTAEEALQHTKDANDFGKAAVFHGTRTEAEGKMEKLHAAVLHATVERAS